MLEPDEKLEKAVEDRDRERLEERARHYAKLIEEHPEADRATRSTLQVRHGLVLLSLGEEEEGLEHIASVLSDSTYCLAAATCRPVELYDVLIEVGQYRTASAVCEQAMELLPIERQDWRYLKAWSDWRLGIDVDEEFEAIYLEGMAADRGPRRTAFLAFMKLRQMRLESCMKSENLEGMRLQHHEVGKMIDMCRGPREVLAELWIYGYFILLQFHWGYPRSMVRDWEEKIHPQNASQQCRKAMLSAFLAHDYEEPGRVISLCEFVFSKFIKQPLDDYQMPLDHCQVKEMAFGWCRSQEQHDQALLQLAKIYAEAVQEDGHKQNSKAVWQSIYECEAAPPDLKAIAAARHLKG